MSKGKHKSAEQSQKEKYQKIYQKWKRVYCPALQTEVEFTNLGLLHITKTTRTFNEKITRLKLLPDAKHIIETSEFYQGKDFSISMITMYLKL